MLKKTTSESASTIVVMKGLAITAGSKPSFCASMGKEEPTSFARITVTQIVRETLNAT